MLSRQPAEEDGNPVPVVEGPRAGLQRRPAVHLAQQILVQSGSSHRDLVDSAGRARGRDVSGGDRAGEGEGRGAHER